MRVTLGCGPGAMPQDSANQVEALAMRYGGGRKAMAQVVNSHIGESGVQPNSLPRLLNSSEVGFGARSGNDKLACATVLLGNLSQHLERRLGQGHSLGTVLTVGQAGKTESKDFVRELMAQNPIVTYGPSVTVELIYAYTGKIRPERIRLDWWHDEHFRCGYEALRAEEGWLKRAGTFRI